MDTALYRNGFFRPDVNPFDILVPSTIALKLYYVERIFYSCCMYAVKAAMISLYLDFIPRNMKKSRLAAILTAVLIWLGWTSSILVNILICLPIQRQWYMLHQPSLYRDDI